MKVSAQPQAPFAPHPGKEPPAPAKQEAGRASEPVKRKIPSPRQLMKRKLQLQDRTAWMNHTDVQRSEKVIAQ
jgi:hypothetical protein